jgi:hypothetical protein
MILADKPTFEEYMHFSELSDSGRLWGNQSGFAAREIVA